jgi:hypothetical protein
MTSQYSHMFTSSALKVKLSLCLNKQHVMKMGGGVEVYFHIFLTLARDVHRQLHAPVLLMTGERTPGMHWIGGWVGLRADLYILEKRKFSCP